VTRRTQLALGLDLICILFFAAIGRINHGESVLGTPLTAWPFVVGAGVGWFLVRRRSGQDPLTVGPGITVWACTLVVGMLLRGVTGGGVALSFVLVATIALGIMLLGWRVISDRLAADRAAAESVEEPHDVDA
jgi:Protein of unknown function (DUF3054)